MKIEFLTDDSEVFLCDRYKISELKSTEELLNLHKKLTQENPGFLFLLTLDDVNQAAYTSSHARERYDIDRRDGHDLSGLPKRCFEEDGEHIGYLRTKEEFKIRRTNILAKPAASVDVLLEKYLSLSDAQYGQEFINANKDLFSICDGSPKHPAGSIYCLKVPVEKNYELICAFPNGYFTGGLNPFENLALAKHLEEKYRYFLIGIGASYIAFERQDTLERTCLDELQAWLMKIYWRDYGPFEASFFADFLEETLSSQNVLVFRHSE